MDKCPDFKHLLVLPHLNIHNANAISGPLTHGFPSITAFLGFMWALERKLRAQQININFRAIGVVSHGYEEQVSDTGFVKTFRLTRNPLASNGNTAAIVEEGRIHLDLSLVLAFDYSAEGVTVEKLSGQIEKISEIVSGMRVAGGSIVPQERQWQQRYRPYIEDLTGTVADRESVFRKLRTGLLPGFTLVSRQSRLEERLHKLMQSAPESTSLDAWLSLSRVNWHYQSSTNQEGQDCWVNDRTGMGWLVPIPVGYGAISELHDAGTVPNARDHEVPFRFVETIHSIGEWISPHRLDSARDMLWYSDSQPDKGLYRCRNDYEVDLSAPEDAVDISHFDLSIFR